MSKAEERRRSDAPATLGEVRYSLPQMLRELKADRASTSFAMEKLDQASITRIFEPNRARRASKSRK